MSTNRTPIARPALTMITPRAIELFSELERSRRARKHAVDCTISEQGLCTANCRACRLWWDAHAALHTEFRFGPWVGPCLPSHPYPPLPPDHRPSRPALVPP